MHFCAFTSNLANVYIYGVCFAEILRIKNIHVSIKFVLLSCFVIMEKAIANAFNNRVCRICFPLIYKNTDHITKDITTTLREKIAHIEKGKT